MYNFQFLCLIYIAGSSAKQQTDPPSIAIRQLFPDGNFPVGEEVEYGANTDRYGPLLCYLLALKSQI